ncbi:MAG TPA: class I SAM-dependent methyltransferase [Chryseolinea sp.]|nr:class I SAM-dependent methyltransferase [Chryseolinea sp.]
MQKSLLEQVVDRISTLNPLHSKKVKRNLKKMDEAYFRRADAFLNRYNSLLGNEGKDLEYGIDCYLKMIADVNFESVQFAQTGEYTSKSFDEVNARVYSDPEVMEYYMHGLVMSQFLWVHHYDILLHFNDVITRSKKNIKRYLEVGGGHGLYISEAISIIGSGAIYDLVDISKSSIEIARKMISNDTVNYNLLDVFEYFPASKYDFITMGEVLEHVEDPVRLLKKLHSLVNDEGKVYVTTPTNAPAIDHIYLFKNADDIRNVIKEAGFSIEEERCIYAEDVTPEFAEQYKISMMFAGVLVKAK